MSLTSFQDLLDASHQQPEPQRLLFVFVSVELPEAATDDQRERFSAREGGTLSPSLCVDKAPSQIANFDALVGWIQSMSSTYGVEASDLSADRAEGVGVVNARVTLQDSP